MSRFYESLHLKFSFSYCITYITYATSQICLDTSGCLHYDLDADGKGKYNIPVDVVLNNDSSGLNRQVIIAFFIKKGCTPF